MHVFLWWCFSVSDFSFCFSINVKSCTKNNIKSNHFMFVEFLFNSPPSLLIIITFCFNYRNKKKKEKEIDKISKGLKILQPQLSLKILFVFYVITNSSRCLKQSYLSWKALCFLNKASYTKLESFSVQIWNAVKSFKNSYQVKAIVWLLCNSISPNFC